MDGEDHLALHDGVAYQIGEVVLQDLKVLSILIMADGVTIRLLTPSGQMVLVTDQTTDIVSGVGPNGVTVEANVEQIAVNVVLPAGEDETRILDKIVDM